MRCRTEYFKNPRMSKHEAQLMCIKDGDKCGTIQTGSALDSGFELCHANSTKFFDLNSRIYKKPGT